MILKLNVSKKALCVKDEKSEPKWLYFETSKLLVERFFDEKTEVNDDTTKEYFYIYYEKNETPTPNYVVYTDKQIIILNNGICGFILNDKGQTVERLLD